MRRMSQTSPLVLGAAVALALSGCRVGPDYESPEISMPDAWQQELIDGEFRDDVDLGCGGDCWKTRFSTISCAAPSRRTTICASRSLASSKHEPRFGIAAGELAPDIDATGGYDRFRISKNNPIFPYSLGRHDQSFFDAGFDMTWELDFWGRLSRTIEAAGTAFQASIEDHRDAGVTLFAEVARTYVAVRTLQARLAIVETNAQTQRESRDLAIERRDAGLAPDLDVAQAETNLGATEAAIPPLREGIVLTMNRLATLIGEQPGMIREELREVTPIPEAPERIVVGMPANLLRQRPDVRAAERRLASQTAQIGIATAELYPNFALTGSFGFVGSQLDDWLTAPSRFYSIGPQFRWNLFDGGRVRNQIHVQNTRTDQALEQYEQTVLLALEEVESAMTSFVEAKLELAALDRAVEAAKRASSLSLDLYRTGVRTFQDVLDAQRELLNLQDRLTATRGDVTDGMIRIYKSLGGGWARPQPPQQPAEAGEAESAEKTDEAPKDETE